MQTAVAKAPKIGVAGDIADLGTALSGGVDSATSEEASGTIPFGTMVARGTADGGAKKLHTSSAAMADALLGIAVRAHDFAVGSELDAVSGELKPGATFGVGRKGKFWVKVEQAVTPASSVRVRVIVAGAEVAGAFRGTADANDCVDISALAQYRTTAGIGELAIVEIDMTNLQLAVAD